MVFVRLPEDMSTRSNLSSSPDLRKYWNACYHQLSIQYLLAFNTGGATVGVWQPGLQNLVSTALFSAHSVLFIPGFSTLKKKICFNTLVVFLFLYYHSLLGVFQSKLPGRGSDAFGWLHSMLERSPGSLLKTGFLALASISVIIGGPIRDSWAAYTQGTLFKK